MILVYLLIALFGGAVTVFALQNLDPVAIRFLGWRIEGIPLALVMLLSIVGGAFIASLVGVAQSLRQRARIRQLERRLAAVPSERPPAPPAPRP